MDSRSNEERILVLAPTVRDGALCRAVLTEAGFQPWLCSDLAELVRELCAGAATALVPGEVLLADGMLTIGAFLQQQPAWSDLSLIVLTASGSDSQTAIRALETLGNVMLLDRPLRMSVLTSAVRAAVRSRRRQYQIREHLAERERAMQRERELRRESEAANRMKDEFLSVVSHELRTPLTAMLGWSRLLRDGALEERERREALEVVQRNAQAQAQLVEDLLDVSRMASGNLRIEVQYVDLAGVVGLALEVVGPGAEAKGVSISCSLASDLFVLGDPDRLQQVVWNLVSNAVKFTPAGGGVEVRLARVEDQVHLSVADSGDGIDPQFLPHVFDRFRQADATTTRRHGGLGLGLAIVKNLVELHGGSVRAESGGLGRGARFEVRLPFAKKGSGLARARSPQASSSKPGAARRLAGLSILVVDDTADTRDLLAKVLRQQGAEVEVAGDAQSVLERMGTARYDLLLTDLGMPDVDGFALLDRVRALGPDRGGDVTAIAVTGFAGPEMHKRCIESGFATHVAKPFDLPALLDTISGVLARSERPSSRPAPT